MSWISSLNYSDLQLLRQCVWRVHFQHLPHVPFDAREADKLIEALGPEVAERIVERMVDHEGGRL